MTEIQQALQDALAAGRQPQIPHLTGRRRRAYERAAIRKAREMHGYPPPPRFWLAHLLMLAGAVTGGLAGVAVAAIVAPPALAGGVLGIGGAAIGLIAGGILAIRIEDRGRV